MYNMGWKSFIQSELSLRWLANIHCPTSDAIVLKKFLKPHYSKFAVECDWNSKISQNVQNLSSPEKVDRFFGKKSLFFFEKNR